MGSDTVAVPRVAGQSHGRTGPDRTESQAPGASARRRRLPHLGALSVLLIGLLVTTVLSLGARSVHDTNEKRLLRQRVREAGAVATAAIPNIQTPLASAAVLADATKADARFFKQLMTPAVSNRVPFISASLWSTTNTGTPRPLVVVGSRPELASEPPATIRRLLEKATATRTVTINNLLTAPERRLGYAYAEAENAKYVVYAEAALPKSRRANIDRNSAFADLGYALYVGRAPVERNLLASSTGGSLPKGQSASVAVPFGNDHLLVVMTANKELGGNLLARLPWILALMGVALTLAGASLVERLQRRRDHAESLASENAELYNEQRSVAQTLQHSLLPESLPAVPGLEFSTRYVAGVEGIDVGGDWYDVMSIDDGRIVFVVGDVSGRGLRAATTMAELRYGVRAYATQGDAPQEILTKVSRLINVGRDGQFATALCGEIDVAGHHVTLANAGHPNPLIVGDDGAEYASTIVGAPLGVPDDAPYRSVTVAIPARGTLLAYTDGLIERRGENLEVGFERLKQAAVERRDSVEGLLVTILEQTIPTGSADDTAILGVRWEN
jgi:serine phosphatase RsbU (regulator of sigma subunit)